MLVAHHLIKLLDAASKAGLILEEISVVPYANPIGLSQQLLGAHIGRFSVDTGRNFNRDFIDMGPLVSEKIGSILTDNPCENVRIIRKALLAEADNLISMKEESEMKRILYRMACISDIVIDLHCDSDAIMHMYMNDRLWPRLADLASELRSECQLLAPAAGFDSFDEACSCPWSDLQDRFPSYPIPMGCESVTVELRGESDVSFI